MKEGTLMLYCNDQTNMSAPNAGVKIVRLVEAVDPKKDRVLCDFGFRKNRVAVHNLHDMPASMKKKLRKS